MSSKSEQKNVFAKSDSEGVTFSKTFSKQYILFSVRNEAAFGSNFHRLILNINCITNSNLYKLIQIKGNTQIFENQKFSKKLFLEKTRNNWKTCMYPEGQNGSKIELCFNVRQY